MSLSNAACSNMPYVPFFTTTVILSPPLHFNISRSQSRHRGKTWPLRRSPKKQQLHLILLPRRSIHLIQEQAGTLTLHEEEIPQCDTTPFLFPCLWHWFHLYQVLDHTYCLLQEQIKDPEQNMKFLF